MLQELSALFPVLMAHRVCTKNILRRQQKVSFNFWLPVHWSTHGQHLFKQWHKAMLLQKPTPSEAV